MNIDLCLLFKKKSKKEKKMFFTTFVASKDTEIDSIKENGFPIEF